jgi:uncharacterized Zn-binding protein involved in type VI secretion
MSPAARVDDPIVHTRRSPKGLLAALAVGAKGSAWPSRASGLAAVTSVGASAAQAAAASQQNARPLCKRSTGHIQGGSANVYINGKPAARAHVDAATCDEHEPKPRVIAQGSDSVYINGQPAARVGDRTSCKAKISSGSRTVFIGGGTHTTDTTNLNPPQWLESAMRVVAPHRFLGDDHGSAIGTDLLKGANELSIGKRCAERPRLGTTHGAYGEGPWID